MPCTAWASRTLRPDRRRAERGSRPCRVYAPVGSHETLLAYLVRRLLENGANTSFVNRIADPNVPVATLIEDPVAAASALTPVGAPHPRIALPRDLFAPARANSAGLDLSNEARLAELGAALAPAAADPPAGARAIVNPADRRDIVGWIVDADAAGVEAVCAAASGAWPDWRGREPAERAAILARAATLFEEHAPRIAGLICREAGKTLPNALGDVREAVDFLRYYGAQVASGFDNATHRPLGVVACISPWNFPIAIFTGQIAAALSAAGNAVIAKPAEETPLIAVEAVRLLHETGVPADALRAAARRQRGRLPRSTANPHVAGVMFTGSTEVARLIAASLAERLRRRRPTLFRADPRRPAARTR